MELFSPGHLIVLAIIVAILFFGWKQLPDMARSAGRSLRIFKTEIKGMTEDDRARDEAREAGPKPVIDATPQDAAPIDKPAPATGSGSAAGSTAKPNDAA